MTDTERDALNRLVRQWREEATAHRNQRQYDLSAQLQSCASDLQNVLTRFIPTDTTP